MIKTNTKVKRNPVKSCFRCGGQPVQEGCRFDLRANAAIVHWRCSKCHQPIVQFRTMTEEERQAEARRILAEDEARRAAEAAKAEREAQARADYEAEQAEIILAQRRRNRRA